MSRQWRATRKVSTSLDRSLPIRMTSALSLATSVPDPMAIPQGREKLSDRQCRQKSDGHRKFHCHLAVDNVLKGFFEDGVATDQSRSDANYADAREWLPNSKPDRSRSDYHEGNANEFSPLNSLRVSARPATRRRSFISWEFRSKALVGDFSIKGEGFIAKHSLAVLPKAVISSKTSPCRSLHLRPVPAQKSVFVFR